MNTQANRRPRLALAVMVGALLGGCVVVPVGPPPGAPPQVFESVMVAPPPAQAEVIAVAPYPGYFWISGFWAWQLGRHVWIGGHWQAPRPGFNWVPHGWHRHGPGWRAAPGYWAPR